MGYPEDGYDKGTCTLTNLSAVVNFQNATLPATLRTVDVNTFGDYLLPEGYPGSLLEIQTRNSATQLTLTAAWTGSTEIKIDYQIIGRSASKSIIVPNYDMIEEDFLGTVGGIGAPPTPAAHAASHQNGGADEVNVVGLSGLLADGQTPLGHNASHKHGGADEVATATPAANVIPKADAAGDLDAFISSATTGALGLIKLANHLGGSALLPTVIGMQETGGPTSLITGAVADGAYIRRSGATLVGGTPGGGIDVYTYAALPAYDASRYLAYDTDTFTLWVWIYGANGFWFPAVPGPGLDVFVYRGTEAGSGAVANAGQEKWYYYKLVSGTWRTSPRLSRPTMELQIPAATGTWLADIYAGVDAVGNYPMRTWNLTQDYGMIAIVSMTSVTGGAAVGLNTLTNLTGTVGHPKCEFAFDVGTWTSWRFRSSDAAGNQDTTDTTIAVSTAAFQELAFKGIAGTSIRAYVDGVLKVTHNTVANLPDAAQAGWLRHYSYNGNAAKSLHLHYIIFWQKSV